MAEDTILLLKGKLFGKNKYSGFNDITGKYDVMAVDGKKYSYNRENVDVLKKAESLEMPVKVVLRSSGKPLDKVIGVQVFRSFSNSAYRVFFENGISSDYLPLDLYIEKSVTDKKSLNVLDYLKEVSKFSHIPLGEGKEISLSQKYDRVSMVSEKSALALYLNPDRKIASHRHTHGTIFPFGCNRSQYKAVVNALDKQLSIIQGPPGTGKTQTILNIVANLLLMGKTMEIVSNNNSAVQNVLDKLAKPECGMDWLVAKLGNSTNKEEFIQNQTGKIPDISSWERDGERLRYLSAEVIRLSEELQILYEAQERKAICESDLEALLLEMKQDPARKPELSKIGLPLSSKTAMNMLLKYSLEFETKGSFSLWTRIRLWLKRLPMDPKILEILQNKYYVAKEKELRSELSDLKDKLSSLKSKQDTLVSYSMERLRAALYERYGKRVVRTVFAGNEIAGWKSTDFLKEYPVVLSTTFSATTNVNQSVMFDYLIMDEASQVDVSSGALALNCAYNAVVVGDLKQLPNVVTEEVREAASFIRAKYQINEAYEYSSNSFLKSVCCLFPNAPSVLLREHYRCHPLIIGFCNKQFYGGQLISMLPAASDDDAMVLYRTVAGDHARGAYNRRQVEAVVGEIVPSLEERYSDIGVIAPYNEQVNALRESLNSAGKPEIAAATVHKFQGRENDAIVLSTVDNEVKTFTDDPHLLNVAVSRAKKKFVLVVNGNEQPDSNIKDLMEYIKYVGVAVEGKTKSVFDLLYSQYTADRMEFLRGHNTVSRFDSENIMFSALENYIKEKELDTIGILCHYPLHLLVGSSAGLTNEEFAFAYKSWSHLDFLIYNKVTHEPLLAIEVDGVQFHSGKSAQTKNDRLKDSILTKLGLPILRLSTNGENEIAKVDAALAKRS